MKKTTSIQQHTFITSYAIGSLLFCCLGRKARRNNFIVFKPPVLGDRQLDTSIESCLPQSSHTASVHGFGEIEIHILFGLQGGTTWLGPFHVSTFLKRSWLFYSILKPFLKVCFKIKLLNSICLISSLLQIITSVGTWGMQSAQYITLTCSAHSACFN